jgi:hypothetical protein
VGEREDKYGNTTLGAHPNVLLALGEDRSLPLTVR